jgi:hypothetical protein
MTYKTMQYRPAERERSLRPVFGAAAVVAAMATLGLAVVGPAALARSEPAAQVTAVAYRSEARPTEVAILPASIQVVGKRTKTGPSASPYLPATYKPG